MITPLHVATVGGHPLRFFKTPLNDGRPDLPWHAVDDHARERGMKDRQRNNTLRPPTLVHLAANYPSELVLATVCRLTALGDWTDAEITRWIDPQRILARPWNPGRLARARRMLANGDVAPPIAVVGYRIGSEAAIYECEDGIHRTVAAREAGRKVKARIKGYYQLRPQAFVLHREHLWYPRPSQPGWWWQVADVSAEMHPILHALGIRAMDR